MGFVGGTSSQTTERSRYRFSTVMASVLDAAPQSQQDYWPLGRKRDGKQGRVGTNRNCKDGPKPSDMNWNPHRSRTASKSPASVRWLTRKASGTLQHEARRLAASERDGRRAPGGIWRSSGVLVTSLAGESADEWHCVSSTSA